MSQRRSMKLRLNSFHASKESAQLYFTSPIPFTVTHLTVNFVYHCVVWSITDLLLLNDLSLPTVYITASGIHLEFTGRKVFFSRPATSCFERLMYCIRGDIAYIHRPALSLTTTTVSTKGLITFWGLCTAEVKYDDYQSTIWRFNKTVR